MSIFWPPQPLGLAGKSVLVALQMVRLASVRCVVVYASGCMRSQMIVNPKTDIVLADGALLKEMLPLIDEQMLKQGLRADVVLKEMLPSYYELILKQDMISDVVLGETLVLNYELTLEQDVIVDVLVQMGSALAAWRLDYLTYDRGAIVYTFERPSRQRMPKYDPMPQ